MKTTSDLARELEFPAEELEQVATLGEAMYFFKKSRKGTKVRTLRCGKDRLVRIQRAIQTRILNRLPLPRTMHGWRRGHSPRTYANKHTGQQVVLNVDIQDFFPSVHSGRVCSFWESVGYEPAAARLLTLLTTCNNQLPQGAVTSPGLGNQILQGLHRRLGFAADFGLNCGGLGDEVSISGRLRAKRFRSLVLKILRQEGFKVNPEKVKVMHQHERQEIAGIVVNRKPTLGRSAYRNLSAIIYNCIKYGPQSQNREGHPHFRDHLRGRVAYFLSINRRLGTRLERQFARIQWTTADGR